MIQAARSPLRESILRRYVSHLCATRFSGIYALGTAHIRALDPSRPVICIANHTNWWDGFMTSAVSARMPSRHTFCMMEERQLRHHRFLRHMGAFSVDPGSPASAAASLRYAIRLLSDPSSALWIFPQGTIQSPHAPIRPRPGAAFLARKVPRAQILPVIFRYAFFDEDRPHALIGIGAPSPAGPGTANDDIAARLDATREIIDPLVLERDLAPFDVLQAPGLSLNKRWEWLRRAATGQLREFTPRNG
ncbi:MAG: lysophospholipid acyltransferase family protein [Verrucomicrobiae bacterium]|nr:lysophospholipid acyltransferase family protein [Verrucomicrobiae bacterium]